MSHRAPALGPPSGAPRAGHPRARTSTRWDCFLTPAPCAARPDARAIPSQPAAVSTPVYREYGISPSAGRPAPWRSGNWCVTMWACVAGERAGAPPCTAPASERGGVLQPALQYLGAPTARTLALQIGQSSLTCGTVLCTQICIGGTPAKLWIRRTRTCHLRLHVIFPPPRSPRRCSAVRHRDRPLSGGSSSNNIKDNNNNISMHLPRRRWSRAPT